MLTLCGHTTTAMEQQLSISPSLWQTLDLPAPQAFRLVLEKSFFTGRIDNEFPKH